MLPLRALVRDHRRLAGLLIGLALLMKALVPAGYMAKAEGRVLTIAVCADASNGQTVKHIMVPVSGKSSDNHADHAKADGTCAFSSLAMGAVGGADPLLLLIALSFILLLGFAPAAPPLHDRRANLRPPLRGPPVPA